MTKNRDTEKSHKTTILAALIGSLGIVVVALINNVSSWRKDSAPVVEPVQTAQDQSPEKKGNPKGQGNIQSHPANQETRPTLPSIDLFPISGKIEDENGRSIGNVQVSGKGISTRSDEQGRFEIRLPFKSMTDEVILAFEKEGFETYFQSFNRSQSQLTVPITLKKKN